MAIEIFWGSGSPFSWRVLLMLEAKGLAYQSRRLEFSKGDHRTAAFLALNPRGRVPALRDDGYVIYESVAILAYLERRYPTPPLFGVTPEETGRVWRVISEALCYLDGPTDDFILPLYFGRAAQQGEQVRAALPRIHQELAGFESTLRGASWLATGALSAADLTVYPLVKSVLRAAGKPDAAAFQANLLPFAEKFPALAAWLGRVEALPGYERTYPPHWR
jgi:glutathione S-transferase